jgi:branched-subunit amino acid ABC-type transport system permease component
MSAQFVLLQALNCLSFAALLSLLAAGFTLVYGLMRIVILAHGALSLLGSYVGSRSSSVRRSPSSPVLCRRWQW